MKLLSDSIGRKVLMAVTGLLMVLFVVGHLLGNLSIFAGANGLNAYAQKLHDLAPVVWITRIVMFTAVVVHLILSIQITLENEAANPTKYAVNRSLRATFASKSMIWTGLLLGAFITYHLLHFTVRVTPGLALGTDSLDRFDVFTMVVTAFQRAPTALLYVVGMVALFLHLSHGAQSSLQTLGLGNDKTLPVYGTGGRVLSTIFLIGYGAIPVAILLHLIG
ncbi:MAG: succinate dehydrogenase cytochrome b subunit [Anaeromyxobacter sp.]|nr:succinate dehydrogenase cytochrome b subunit [Anaeromyxobacter sp.]MBL0276685.1 succinate dehydrogenase cytochrome b subunit [Anaeromyxobacter sp.]